MVFLLKLSLAHGSPHLHEFILFSTGGWVEKRLPFVLPDNVGIIKSAFKPSTWLKFFVGFVSANLVLLLLACRF